MKLRFRLSSILYSALTLALIVGAPVARAESARDRAQKLMKTMLKDRDPRERAEAAQSLGEMGATDAVPSLTKALSDDDRNVRASAAGALWKLGEVSRPAQGALKKAFEDGSGWLRLNAGGALEMLGTDRKELLTEYQELLTRNHADVRVEAAKRLQGLVPDKVLMPAVSKALKDEDSDVRSEAEEVMRHLKPEGSDAVTTILDGFRNRDSHVRSSAIRQVADIRPIPKEAIPKVIGMLNDRDEYVRTAAIEALGHWGAVVAKDSVPPLLEILAKDSDPEMRSAAAKAIADIGPAAKSAIPALLKTLKEDKVPAVRADACEGLSRMGTLAKEAIPALEAAQKDADGFVRGAAWRALLRVDPKK
jgi:HEAT repeat protein